DWQVPATAGHAPAAVVLFEPRTRTLISGDALWQDRLAIVFPELEDQPGFDDVARTLDRIEALDPALVVPGHGQPFTDVAGALRASRQRLAGFVAAPQRHRLHAARALVVYHLLSFRQLPHAELLNWIATTPIFVSALQCAGNPERAQALAQETLDRLVADGVVQDDGPLAADRQVRMAAPG
ncbi:MAG: MBL fold metallo-hydrolase, partial [Burkholderiales bacterium PBB5]